MTSSALYFGRVTHQRLEPRRHRLAYRVFWMLLDLDEIDEIADRIPILSRNRFNLASFHDADHGDASATPLRAQVERRLSEAGISFDGGPIRLLCMPRILGYGFNPLSVYFCHRRDGTLAAILYEVHNTFGERHTYVFDTRNAEEAARHGCAKRFHVSPFMDIRGVNYEFRVAAPAERIAITIKATDHDGPVLVAALSGTRQPFTGRMFARALALFPLLTFKVIAAIHWHALLLWAKRIPVRGKPAPPRADATIVPHGS